jgi:hypothetical protein
MEAHVNGPWFPTIRKGEASNSIYVASTGDEQDVEGWYLQIAWLGFMVSVEIGSVGRHCRMIERWRREDKA